MLMGMMDMSDEVEKGGSVNHWVVDLATHHVV